MFSLLTPPTYSALHSSTSTEAIRETQKVILSATARYLLFFLYHKTCRAYTRGSSFRGYGLATLHSSYVWVGNPALQLHCVRSQVAAPKAAQPLLSANMAIAASGHCTAFLLHGILDHRSDHVVVREDVHFPMHVNGEKVKSMTEPGFLSEPA